MLKYLLLILIFSSSAVVAHGQRSSHFRLVHPVDSSDAKYVLDLLEHDRSELLQRVSNAGLDAHLPTLEIVFNASTGDFIARTGMPSWAAAATRKNRIELQPLTLLKQRRILESTLRHELAHALIDALGNGQTPRWLAEGMAIYLAGEGIRFRPTNSASTADIEQTFATAKSAEDMKVAYAAAYHLVQELIRREGENKVWKRLADRSYSVNIIVVPTLTRTAS
ncbi:MAG TPA: hypothetical protein VFT08_06405 [Pyrinomonadaceae bacterium]|nr:hypothetical protein [Pyrinomonadaceae bacterium]